MRVLVGNVYVGNRQRRAFKAAVRRLRPAVFLAQESYGLGAIKGYHRLSPPFLGEDARMTSVYVREDVRIHGLSLHMLADAVPGARYEKERWTCEVRGELAGLRFAAFSVHANVLGMPALRAANKQYGARLRGLMRLAERQGYRAFAGGDWNEYGPNGLASRVARRLGGSVRLHKIDGIVTTDQLAIRSFRTVVLPGSDHAGVVADLGPTPAPVEAK